MNHDEWLERAEIYATGALDGAELADFEAHRAAGCPLCENRLRESRETLAELARSLAPLEPPARVKTELLARLGAEAKRPKLPWIERMSFDRLRWAAGAGALAAAGLVAVLTWNLVATRSRLQDAERQLTALQSQFSQREEVLQLLSDPGVRIVNLAALPAGAGARGQLLWNPSSRTGMLLVSGLPQTPAGKAYELWGIAGAEPVPAGLFVVDTGGLALVRLPRLADSRKFDKFAVTLEPAGGVPQPTGAMVLLGKI